MTSCDLLMEKMSGTIEIEKIRVSPEFEKDRLAEERAMIRKNIRVGKERKKADLGEVLIECPECKSRALEFDSVRAETVCGKCGLVLEENIVDHGPEWGTYKEEKCARAGPPPNILLHDKGLSTFIDWKNRDAKGKYIPKESFAKMSRLRFLQRGLGIRNPKDKNLSYALGELSRMASALGIPKPIQQTAALIYRKVSDGNFIRGRSTESMVTASLYAACKQCKVTRTLDEIDEVSRVSKVQIGRSYRVLLSSLKMGILLPSPLEFIPRFCSPFKLSDNDVQIGAEEIIRRAEQMGVTSGKGPEGIAAAVIYIASRNVGRANIVNQRKLAKIAGVTEVTIRSRYKELVKVLQLEWSEP